MFILNKLKDTCDFSGVRYFPSVFDSEVEIGQNGAVIISGFHESTDPFMDLMGFVGICTNKFIFILFAVLSQRVGKCFAPILVSQ